MTAGSDPFFGPPFIDVDVVRAEPMPHRYVHGGFEGTDTRFSFYFPLADTYEGRMLHVLDGGAGGHEDTAVSNHPFNWTTLAFPFSVGAYLVETNAGHIGADMSGAHGDRTIITYRANAEAARYSKVLAADVYGAPPHHSFLFGGSGGGGRSINCMEHTDGVWDGAVPFVAGSLPGSALYGHLAKALAVLGGDVKKVMDATEVGGSGNPFEGLNTHQREALAALYRAGFPRGGEFLMEYPREVTGVWSSWMAEQVARDDPTYFDDFWNRPGYLGHDGPATIQSLLIEGQGHVREVLSAKEMRDIPSDDPMWRIVTKVMSDDLPLGLVIDGLSGEHDQRSLQCSAVQFGTGGGAGHLLWIIGNAGRVLMVLPTGRRPMDTTAEIPAWQRAIAAGDEVTVDNRQYLAWWHFHRHQIVPDHPGYHQDVVDGIPLHPQRPQLPIMMFSPFTHRFSGKMIVVQGVQDIAVWTAGLAGYHAGVAAALGNSLDDRFRIWWIDRMGHLPASSYGVPMRTSQVIDYLGIVQQAIRDLIVWVEDGVAPPPSTSYTYSPDTALTLAPTAAARRGVQPVVRLAVEAGPGRDVTFRAAAEVPPAAGTIVSVEWDPEGAGRWVSGTWEHAHTYDHPGTFIAAVRVTAHRKGDASDPFGRIPALGRCRVVIPATAD